MIFLNICIIASMIVIAITDLRHKYIYDWHLIASACFIIVQLICANAPILNHLLGAITGFLLGYIIYKLSFYIYKEEAFGYGDVLLLALLGLYLSIDHFPSFIVMMCFIVSLMSALYLSDISWKTLRTISIPLAPVFILSVFIYRLLDCPTITNFVSSFFFYPIYYFYKFSIL